MSTHTSDISHGSDVSSSSGSSSAPSSDRLLIVEDDPEVGTGLVLYLEDQGFDVTLRDDGQKGLDEAVTMPGYDMIILDAKLPGRDGFDVLRKARSQGVSTPILMLTGLRGHGDRMRGFELGADDYLTKPFSTDELLARIRAILRRTKVDPDEEARTFRVGGLLVDLRDERVTKNGEPVSLTELEFRLLRYLLVHRGRTATREHILRDVWGLPSDVETRTIDRHVNALRKVMDGDEESTWPIKSIYGEGYKLVGAEAAN
ncbi:MAG: response regulator transcription factor [Rhodothermales bacterium]